MQITDNGDVWSFPDLHNDISGLSLIEREFIKKEAVLQQKIDELMLFLNEKDHKIEEANNLILHYKEELKIQSHVLKSAVDEIHSIIPELGQYMLTFMDDLVKMITKKVIMKEVKADIGLLLNVINNFIKRFEENELIQINLSPNSFARLSTLELPANVKYRINPDLEDTDVIVSTDSSAFRMIVDDVLTHLMNGAYE